MTVCLFFLFSVACACAVLYIGSCPHSTSLRSCRARWLLHCMVHPCCSRCNYSLYVFIHPYSFNIMQRPQISQYTVVYPLKYAILLYTTSAVCLLLCVADNFRLSYHLLKTQLTCQLHPSRLLRTAKFSAFGG